jgi:hypothetical protein
MDRSFLKICENCADYDDQSECCASVDGDFCGSDRKPDEIACLYYWPNTKGG